MHNTYWYRKALNIIKKKKANYINKTKLIFYSYDCVLKYTLYLINSIYKISYVNYLLLPDLPASYIVLI